MEQIIKTYGTFLLEGVAVVLLLALLFAGITDAEGNRGAFAIIGAGLDTGGTDYYAYQDFAVYDAESGKTPPEITGSVSALPKVGDMVCLTDVITAVDYAGNALSISVQSITGPDGDERIGALDADRMTIQFLSSGVYTVQVTAVDDGARRSTRRIAIAVNG